MKLDNKQLDILNALACVRRQLDGCPHLLFDTYDIDNDDMWKWVGSDSIYLKLKLPKAHLSTFQRKDCQDVCDCFFTSDREKIPFEELAERSLLDIQSKLDKWSNSVIDYFREIDKKYGTSYVFQTLSPNCLLWNDEYLFSDVHGFFTAVEEKDNKVLFKNTDKEQYVICVNPDVRNGYVVSDRMMITDSEKAASDILNNLQLDITDKTLYIGSDKALDIIQDQNNARK